MHAPTRDEEEINFRSVANHSQRDATRANGMIEAQEGERVMRM